MKTSPVGAIVVMIAVLLVMSIQTLPVQADWWSKHVAPIGKAINKGAINLGHGLERTAQAIGKNPAEILPVCWGAPQDCRNKAKQDEAKTNSQPSAPVYTASLRVDCVAVKDGSDRGDQTLSISSPVSEAAAQDYAMYQYDTTDLCQATGDMTRRMVRGSNRWV